VEIKNEFYSKYPADETDFGGLSAYGCAAFNSTLKKLMVSHGTTEAGQNDAIRNVQREMDGVREIMTENIERVLERGERIDLLVDKTDRLGGSARDFRVRSRGLRRQMWWKNVKLMVMLGVVAVFLIYLLVGMGCGLPGTCLPSFRYCYVNANGLQDGDDASASERLLSVSMTDCTMHKLGVY
jgi:vesicle-associated membrane protein 7